MTPPTAENFFVFLGCAALLCTLVYGGVRLWRAFYPAKSKDDEPVTRREFETRLSQMQTKSDEFRAKISEDLNRTREGMSRIEEAVRQQGSSFLNMIEAWRRTDADAHRAIERRLGGIEEHLRK